MNGIKSKAGSGTAMLCSQGKRLVKVFTAMRTVIAAFPVMEEGMFAHERKVFDDGNAIIMDFIRQPVAIRAGTSFARERKENMNFCIRRSKIRDNYVFQFQKFCGKIRSRHRVQSFLYVWCGNLII
jgi:hypothetical protein